MGRGPAARIGKMTDENQIKKAMRTFFPKQYRGIFPPHKIPILKRNEIAIVFEGPDNMGHWRTVYNKDGQLYEYDSYFRNREGNKYKDKRLGEKQKPWESNCGQRTVAHLIRVFKQRK